MLPIILQHILANPSLLDGVETYLMPLAQLTLEWKPHNKNTRETNVLERMLLIMAQLSTRFAVEYHWVLQSLLQAHQPEGASKSSFDITKFSRCMTMDGNLQRCMSGNQRPEEKHMDESPQLEIVATHGGKVTNDEVHKVKKKVTFFEAETNKSFYDSIVELADANATQTQPTTRSNPVVAGAGVPTELPMINSFGGVLLFKRQYRKIGRTKAWKKRFFAIEERMLNCYSRDKTVLRSISLEGASLWKGPQKKHPNSFIVANDDTLFFLQASSAEEKSLWKRKLRAVMEDKGPSEGLTETQKERYNKFQQGKWFGRSMVEMSRDLEGVAPDERSDFLYEKFFDLEMPNDVCWPWKDEKSAFGLDKSVFVVLPHFSRPLPGHSSFQASFILNEEKENATERAYRNFIQEGRQEPTYRRIEIPEMISAIMNETNQLDRSSLLSLKNTGGGSVSGESTDQLSMESMSEDSMVVDSTDSDSCVSSPDADNEFDVGSLVGTCATNESCDLSSCGSEKDDEVEFDFDDDCSLRPPVNFAVELVLAEPEEAEAPKREEDSNAVKDESMPKAIEDDLLSGGVDVKYSILPQTTQGLISLCTKQYVPEEILALQLAKYYQSLLQDSSIWCKPPRVQRINVDTVIMELPKKSTSIAEAKKLNGGRLINYFIETHGSFGSSTFEKAQACFTRSLAGLALLSYVLGIKNRHDGNFMMDEDGHIFASDLSASLGSSPTLEVAPFKLTNEYLDVMGGEESTCYKLFCDLFVIGYKIACDDAATANALVRVLSGKCFTAKMKHASKATKYLRERLQSGTSSEVEEKAASLIERSRQNMLTSAFDAISKSKGSVGVEV